METPKISVIVPVYKVEPYLRKCLDSIVGQTYQNLEIILVDDGSPDSCGEICDEYAEMDNRIQVVHKKNGGVSSARNTGLKKATGAWISWVDSDDWIDLDMLSYLMEHVMNTNADIAVCSRLEQYRDQSVFRGWKRKQVLNTEKAMELLLENDAMQNFLWDKLWRRELFDEIIFPEGRTYEDIAVMHRLFARAEKVVCLPEAKYHYLQRAGSIVGTVSLQNRMNHYEAAKQRYEEMKVDWPQFEPILQAQCVASAIGIWCAYWRNSKEARAGTELKLNEISDFGRQHIKTALEYMNLGITGRAVLRLIPYPRKWSFALANCFGWLYQLKHGRAL